MVTPEKDEERMHYLCRVLKEFMDYTIAGEETIDYDEATCDGACLVNDIVSELGYDDIDTI